MKNEKKIKKYSLRYEYMILELSDVKEQLIEHTANFNLYIIKLEKQHDITIFDRSHIDKPKPKARPGDETVDKKHDKKQDQLFKDLYSHVVKKTHPDKTKDDPDLTRVFRQATKAKNTDDLMSMLKICDDMDITIPQLTPSHEKMIETDLKKIQDEINRMKKLDAWIWGQADSDQRNTIEKNILSRFKK